ncbi:unnamed protein product [Parajaminaea phylloscopi]
MEYKTQTLFVASRRWLPVAIFPPTLRQFDSIPCRRIAELDRVREEQKKRLSPARRLLPPEESQRQGAATPWLTGRSSISETVSLHRDPPSGPHLPVKEGTLLTAVCQRVFEILGEHRRQERQTLKGTSIVRIH